MANQPNTLYFPAAFNADTQVVVFKETTGSNLNSEEYAGALVSFLTQSLSATMLLEVGRHFLNLYDGLESQNFTEVNEYVDDLKTNYSHLMLKPAPSKGDKS